VEPHAATLLHLNTTQHQNVKHLVLAVSVGLQLHPLRITLISSQQILALLPIGMIRSELLTDSTNGKVDPLAVHLNTKHKKTQAEVKVEKKLLILAD
jgi:hypothetical protein